MPPITRVLGELPSGLVSPWSMDQVSKYIRECTIQSDGEDARRKAARLRLDLYQDRGEAQITGMIDAVFRDPTVKHLRKDFAAYAQFQNVTKRVVNEISTVYSEPASRVVSSDNERYQQLQAACWLNRKMRKVNRYTNLLNECVVLYRIRPSDSVPVVDVITPDRFYAIAHPADPTCLVAIMYDSAAAGAISTDPHYTVWTDYELFKLDGNGRVVNGTLKEHGLQRMPAILVHREVPDARLLDGDTGKDLTAAHLSVALLNVLMLKEQKSGSKLAYVTGDLSQTATGQPMDSERVIAFQEGVSPGTLDMGSDPRTYIDAARAVIKQVAANYGIPESVFDLSYQATSGFEIELKRVGLREKRREQIMDYRHVERGLAEVMSGVSGFGIDGWMIDFGDADMPQDPSARLAYWRELRQMSLMSTVDMMMQLQPELSREQALREVLKKITEEDVRTALLKGQNALNGGAGDNATDEDEQELTTVQRPRSGPPPQEV